MVDLNIIKARHLSEQRLAGQTLYEGHIAIDLAACVEEIEQLRQDDRDETASLLLEGCADALGLNKLHVNAQGQTYLPSWHDMPQRISALLAEVERLRAGVSKE